jgi:hypothetical protein
VLQVLLVALLFGFALAAMGERARPVTALLETVSQSLFGVINFIMRFAPIGAFGAMAFTVGKYGVVSLAPLLKLIGTFYLTSFLFVFLVLGTIARIAGFRISRFLAYIKEEILLVLGTSSSDTALPTLMGKLEKLGCSRPLVGLIVPTGYTFNTDGTAIYMTMAALFVAQATNTELSLLQQMAVFGVERRQWRAGRLVHCPRRHAGRRAHDPRRGHGPDPRHRPLHERGESARQHDRQRRRHRRDGALGRRTGRRQARRPALNTTTRRHR